MTTRKHKFITESDDKEYGSMYSAAINGTRKLNVVDDATGEIIETIIESGRPEDTKKKNKKFRPHNELFIMVYTRVIDAINLNEIEGNEIIVLMNCISRISKQNNYVVNEQGVRMSLRQVAESSKIDKNQFNKTLESLHNKGFLAIVPINKKSNGIQLVNWIASMGKPLTPQE